MTDDPATAVPGLDDPLGGEPGFGVLLELLETVADRVEALDALTGDGVDAQENRTIRQSRARLARAQAQQVRDEVGEVRRQARALASSAGDARQRSTRLSADSQPPGGAVLAAARRAEGVPGSTDAETGRAQRLVDGARHVTAGVCWAQLTVPGHDGVAAWSAGELPPAAVTALADGPRAVILAGADSVVVGEDDDRWPGLAAASSAAGVRSVLALPVGRGASRGALVLAATGAAAFDGPARLVAGRLAEHAASLLPDSSPDSSSDAVAADVDRTRVVLDGARAVLGRHLGVEPATTFDIVLATAAATGEPVLTVAQLLLAALVPRAVDGTTPEPAVLRRAVSYIHDHATESITVEAIAEAAGIGHRGLQQLFRRHHDLTPTQYLRLYRLDRARDELRATDPASGVTVGDVADRWRFTHAGRFSVIFRERFGVSPRSVLRS